MEKKDIKNLVIATFPSKADYERNKAELPEDAIALVQEQENVIEMREY